MSTAAPTFRLADRFSNVGFSEIVVIRNKILAMKARGLQVYQFEGGEPFAPTPQVIKDACTKALAENKTRYAPSSGIPELIEALTQKVRTRNRLPAEQAHIIVTVGGMQGLFAAFQALLNPSDDVLVFSPYWTPTIDLIAMSGGRSILVDTFKARSEGLKVSLEAALTARTRVILLASPQNPTGVVWTPSEMAEIADFVCSHNLIVVSDEAYEDLVYEGQHVSIGSLPQMYERTISCFTFSKSYSMTGWRIGYAVAAEPFITGMKQAVLYSTNGVSTPTQHAAVKAITSCDDFIRENLPEYRRRRDLLVNGLNSLGLDCELPAGAFYAFPSIAKYSSDSREFAAYLLEKASIATVPGVVFGPQGEAHLRFSYSVSIETIERGLEALSKVL
ncbi:MAG: pyridoxal phosphate-dependent aminotransferase [Acidobacteriota bacterium]|nr:pyridoxal phosphate-dependent aminotransferase [Blastocatellia bacterium]MDW8412741.1 pyridoxal phosphate-dependent aminotransferase [Acidobacteriota bacterium]